MRRLSDTTEEVIFGKTKDVLEELERMTREGAGKTELSILHTRQVALHTLAMLRVSKTLGTMSTDIHTLKGVLRHK